LKKLLALLAASTFMSLPSFAADLPDQVQKLHQFDGYWPGTGTLQVGSDPVINFSGYQECSVVADGWSIQCVGHFEGDSGFLLDESFQGAYDLATKQIHWQVMYSQGPQAFTVFGLFNAAGTELPLGRSLTTPEGLLEQSGTWAFQTENHRTLFIDTKLNGQLVSHLTADLSRAKNRP
jgi:hypothetical protein